MTSSTPSFVLESLTHQPIAIGCTVWPSSRKSFTKSTACIQIVAVLSFGCKPIKPLIKLSSI